jgi:predicted TIM-barrel fold metal-dependent hydrolase
VIDAHVHAISSDVERFPHAPLGGVPSAWSQDRPVDADELMRALDAANIEKAVLVQASTVYGFDNSYAAEVLARFPDRLAGVCSVDFVAASAVDDVRHWIEDRGFTGVRIRVASGLTTVAGEGTDMTDERMGPVWAYAESADIPVCIQMHSSNSEELASVLARHPGLTVILDHMGRPDASGGADYPRLAQITGLAAYQGVHLKITPAALRRLDAQPGVVASDVVKALAEAFGHDHLLWGSDFPASGADLVELRGEVETCLEWADEIAAEAVDRGTAARIYQL